MIKQFLEFEMHLQQTRGMLHSDSLNVFSQGMQKFSYEYLSGMLNSSLGNEGD